MADLPQPPPRHIGIIEGFLYFFKGLRLVFREHTSLARIYVVPMILSAVFIVAAWSLVFFYSQDIVEWIWPKPSAEEWWGIVQLLRRTLAVLIWIIVAFILIITATFIFSLLAAPFSDLLSENIEGILGTWAPRPFSIKFLLTDLGQTVQLELLRLGIKMMWLAPLFLLSLIVPVVGQSIYVFFGGFLLCKYTGMDYIDWCAARRGWTWKTRLAFARKQKLPLVGFGAAVLLTHFVPLLFVLAWPGAVAGGAMLFTDLRRKDGTGNLPSQAHDANEEKDNEMPTLR